MTFDLTTIALYAALAVLYAVMPPRWRVWVLLILSALAVYLLQPALIMRFTDYALPTAALFLTVTAWWFTRKSGESGSARENLIALGIIAAVIFGMAAFRYVPAEYRITPSRPPEITHVAVLVVVGAVIVFRMLPLIQRAPRRMAAALILLIVALFVALKTPPIAAALSAAWRSGTGQNVDLASIADWNWLGFSYVAFRLIHTLRDRQTGLLPGMSLREYVTYVIFFPAYIAGPIDRAERFVGDLRAVESLPRFDVMRWQMGLGRIAVGLFKKFIIADTLAQGMALDPRLAEASQSGLYVWVLVYGYALRLFFDFSGYSDIAIGLGILFGIKLPENFNRPYLKTDITAFWQSWHMTLSSWARFYIFTPLSRALLMRDQPLPGGVIVLTSHLVTMITIGLWHGVTVNFFIWGLWQAVGLFVHKQWSDRTRKWYRGLKDQPAKKRAWTLFAWFITFHYVVLGWVWFALATPEQSLRVFGLMFGIVR